MTDLITTLERQEQELVFASFDHADLIVEGIRAHLAEGGGK